MVETRIDKNLELSKEQMRSLGYKIIDIIVDHLDTLKDKPVSRMGKRAEMESLFNDPVPQKPENIEVLIDRLKIDAFENIMHEDHQRFFAYVPSPSNYVGFLAEMLAVGHNVFNGVWRSASSAAQIEMNTIDWLNNMFDFPKKAGGIFVSGGSIANLTAICVARKIKLKNNMKNSVIYYSDQTHSSVEKGLEILGFQEDNLCKIPSNEDFTLNVPLLASSIIKDKQVGKIPFCVIANAGTTNTGSVDRLDLISEICKEYNMWLHADGAYGAPAALIDRQKNLFKGINQVDSLTIDPHKWLFQPIETGCLLVRNADWLKETFLKIPEYLEATNKTTDELNFGNYGIQLTRGFRALKLWMSLKAFGLESFKEAIEFGITLAEYAEELITHNKRWELVSPATNAVISFRYMPQKHLSKVEIDKLNYDITEMMIKNQYAMLAPTTLKGNKAIRLCTINPRATKDDIKNTIDLLEKFGKELEAGC